MRRLSLILTAVFFACGLWAKDIVIYHTSDTHGYYFAKEDENGRMQGGFAALAAFIKKDSKGQANYLLLDSGDFMQGNLEANDSKGMTSARVYNAMGYHAVTIGNHEFDFGASVYDVTKSMDAKVLAANFLSIGTTQEYEIFNVDGVKIGVVGIGLNGGKNKTFKERDTIESYKSAMAEVYKNDVNAVVVLTHSSDYDIRDGNPPKEIAASSPLKAHVMLGGHRHIEASAIADGTLFAESGTQLKSVSKIIMTFDDDTNVFKSAKHEKVPLYIDAVGEDAAIKTILDGIKNPEYEKVIGRLENSFYYTNNEPGRLDSQLGNLMADIVKDSVEDADIGILNSTSFRNILPKGKITVRDLVLSMPYNKLSTIKLSGDFIANLLITTVMPNFSLFQYSGLEADIIFDGDKPRHAIIKINGEPLQKNKVYNVATNEFIAFYGTYEAAAFKDIPAEDKEKFETEIHDLLMQFIAEFPDQAPDKEPRLRTISK
ncbi:2'(,)3'-cyclic-nucleotide 2'-phosphodiesterase (5'-nucleotidase family) [Elusimicrobium simillimum]|uniref:bifunctional metallophosphatase/5'-nucleotidase n=1 Tax=Elusimicrobium simillimum TaxID=3143438 RepID=UPI003C701820